MNFIDIDEAARLLPSVSRVVVLGCSGSGKSTLAAKLARRLGLRHIPMDKAFFWLPGWVPRSRPEIARLVTEAVAGDGWIMDGNNPRTMPIRLPRTQMAIWLRPPRLISLAGVYGRVLRSYGRVRPDMAEGCPEHLPDREFLRYIWNFETVDVPEIRDMFAQYGPEIPVIQLKSRKEAAQLLALLPSRD